MKKLLYSNDLVWLKPYVKKIKHIVPLHQLEKVISYKPNEDQIQHHHAQMVVETWEEEGCKTKKRRKYISINLYYFALKSLRPLKRKMEPFSKIDLLENLAHELAHLSEFDHTPKHKQLEVRMTKIFMAELYKTGYISEEHEMKHNKPRF